MNARPALQGPLGDVMLAATARLVSALRVLRHCVVGLFLLAVGCSAQNRPLQLVSGAGPIYPSEALAAGIEGHVVVRYDVSAQGVVTNAHVHSAEPEGVFEEAALAAVRSFRYNPRMERGQPRAVENVLSTVRFRLDDEDAYDRY